ncbi:hypothetical protein BDV36DRAFT_123829 [Aspergillus pseudocaelatus]|uniref:Uncharacterized protein n=1 Tax=Aspergillus pseudocaelatus TaxID=1825620 RepID=A0ABQ6VZS3_9EURO|nr:hypothetical protein BDV36DRAFT_123829 [Aspergillus pseudocaelatus]
MLTGATIIKQTLEWSRAKSRRLRDEWTGFDGLALKLVENEVVKVGTRGSSNNTFYYFIYLLPFLCFSFFFLTFFLTLNHSTNLFGGLQMRERDPHHPHDAPCRLRMNSTKKSELPDFLSHTPRLAFRVRLHYGVLLLLKVTPPCLQAAVWSRWLHCLLGIPVDPDVGGPIIARRSALHHHPSGRLAPSEHHDVDRFPDFGFEKPLTFFSLG